MACNGDAVSRTRTGGIAGTVQRIQAESRERRRSAQQHIDQTVQRLARGVDRGRLHASWTVEVELVHEDRVISSWSAPGWREPNDTYVVAGRIYVTTGYAQPYKRAGRQVYQVWVRPRGQWSPIEDDDED